MIKGQLSFDLEEKIIYDFENYNWLIGDPDSLIIFFEQELNRTDLRPMARADCLRRLRELKEGDKWQEAG